MTDAQLAQLKRKRDLHMVLPVFLVSVIACIDRVNIAYAKLTMEQDLPWLTPEIFGMGASIFFVGYLIFEVPGALVAARFSAAKWIARIMLTWGMVSASLAFIESETGFFVCRFLLGGGKSLSCDLLRSLPRMVYGARTRTGDFAHAHIAHHLDDHRSAARGDAAGDSALRTARLAGALRA